MHYTTAELRYEMRRPFALALALALVCLPAAARETAPEDSNETGPVGESPAVESRREPGGGQLLPEVDFYFPEGELDFRLRGLIKGSFYEGGIRYNFVDGDIRALLNYRYYGFRRIYQLGLFDSLEFEDLEDFSSDFERTRGGLFLTEWPHSYHRRAFFLAELDRITSNKEEFRFSTGRSDTFLRFGYQVGTANDARSNAIAGNARSEIQPLFTAHREIGPYGVGLTAGLTWGFDFVGGDFDYVRLEFQALKRFNLRSRGFLVGRLHGGTFLRKQSVRDDPELTELEQLSIPRPRFFRLDGRNALKGVGERLRGTDELDATLELFVPWFLDQRRRALGAIWQSCYWIFYSGVGAIGLDRDVLGRAGEYIPDIGVGIEASFEVRGQSFFVGGVAAHALAAEGSLQGRFSIRTYR